MFNRFFIFGGLISCLTLAGCGLFEPRSPANENGKTVLMVLSTATSVMDQVCAGAALARKDVQLAHDCAAAYTSVREKLQAAEIMLDNKDKQLPCAIKLVTSALSDFADVLSKKTGEVPEAVTYGLIVGRAMGSQCKE